jgi:FMN phosphatase YigB (HAD superfamily)
MIITVIFDLDGTLYDKIDFCRSGFRAAAQHVAWLSDASSADEIKDTYTLGPLIDGFLPTQGLCQQPSPRPDAAPKVKIDRIADLAGVLSSS